MRFVAATVSCFGSGSLWGKLVEGCRAMMIAERYDTGFSRSIADWQRK